MVTFDRAAAGPAGVGRLVRRSRCEALLLDASEPPVQATPRPAVGKIPSPRSSRSHAGDQHVLILDCPLARLRVLYTHATAVA